MIILTKFVPEVSIILEFWVFPGFWGERRFDTNEAKRGVIPKVKSK